MLAVVEPRGPAASENFGKIGGVAAQAAVIVVAEYQEKTRRRAWPDLSHFRDVGPPSADNRHPARSAPIAFNNIGDEGRKGKRVRSHCEQRRRRIESPCAKHTSANLIDRGVLPTPGPSKSMSIDRVGQVRDRSFGANPLSSV